MMKKLIILTLLLLGIIFYSLFLKRTPFSILKKGGLNINTANTVKLFKDDSGGVLNIHGDGETLIRIQIDNEPMENIISQVQKKYKKLPLEKQYMDKVPFIFENAYSNEGFYKIDIDKSDNRDYGLIIVDFKNKQVIFIGQIL